MAALAAGGPLSAGTAWADGPGHAGRAALPAVGQEIRCASRASNVVVRTALGESTGDFACFMRMRVEADPNDGASRRLRMLEHRVTGQTEALGRVALTEDLTRHSAPQSTLRLAEPAKPRYELRMVFPRWKVQVERLHAGLLEVAPGEPIELVNTNPMILENRNMLTPMPHGDTLTVREPVALAHPSLRGLAIATIEPFTVRPQHIGAATR